MEARLTRRSKPWWDWTRPVRCAWRVFILYLKRLHWQDLPCICNLKTPWSPILWYWYNCSLSGVTQPRLNSLLMMPTVTARSQKSSPSTTDDCIPRTAASFRDWLNSEIFGVCHLDFVSGDSSIEPVVLDRSPGLLPIIYSRVAPTL